MSKGYSAFSNEDEVLIQDGLEYKVKAIENIKTQENQIYYLITLHYPIDIENWIFSWL